MAQTSAIRRLSEGVSAEVTEDKMEASIFLDIVLENVRIPKKTCSAKERAGLYQRYEDLRRRPYQYRRSIHRYRTK